MASICINLTLKSYSNSVFYHSMDLCVLYSYSVLGKFDYIFLHIKELFLHFCAAWNWNYFIVKRYITQSIRILITKKYIWYQMFNKRNVNLCKHPVGRTNKIGYFRSSNSRHYKLFGWRWCNIAHFLRCLLICNVS